jgi:4-carboxymuconolactone decarboxylase
VSPDDAEAIRLGRQPTFTDPDDALIYAFSTQLYEARRVSDSTYAATVARFGHEVTINLVGLLGYYALVAMTLNVFAMRAQGQETLPFAE